MDHFMILGLTFFSFFFMALGLLSLPKRNKRSRLLLSFNFKRNKRSLPPSSPRVPFFGNLHLLLKATSMFEFEPFLRDLHKKLGPIITFYVGSRPSIFISDCAVVHEALIENGAVFSDRPAPIPATSFLTSNQHNISSSEYGPLWRRLRRNLISEILHPSRVKIFASSRMWVLGVLTQHLHAQCHSSVNEAVVAMESIQFAMFCLLITMCFGEKLNEKIIKNIETANHSAIVNFSDHIIFALFPKISKYLFPNRLKTVVDLRQKQKELFLPLINARKEHKQRKIVEHNNKDRFVYSYVDSVLDMNLPEEGRRSLTEDELVTLCSEFLTAGTDMTSTALQWVMAGLVKNQEIQKKLLKEIESIVKKYEELKEEDLQKMPYLKAVVLEALRRHPPCHFVLPHAVSAEVEIEGFIVPKNAPVNFMVAEIGWDEKVWEEPMEFKPERFLRGGSGEEVDITGSREIKMMPFGVGRRICPAMGLAMLHLQYFVASLVREFEWATAEGDEIDLSEKSEFTVVIKYPLRARLLSRMNA